MRRYVTALTAIALLGSVAPAAANCWSESRVTERHLSHLRPGPNTNAAWHHLNAARYARSNYGCYEELRAANYFADRSIAADRRFGAYRPYGYYRPYSMNLPGG
jgi:hypothetical protein